MEVIGPVLGVAAACVGIAGLVTPWIALARWSGVWRLAAGVPATVIALAALWLAMDTGSSNLWPLTLILVGAGCAVWMAGCWALQRWGPDPAAAPAGSVASVGIPTIDEPAQSEPAQSDLPVRPAWQRALQSPKGGWLRNSPAIYAMVGAFLIFQAFRGAVTGQMLVGMSSRAETAEMGSHFAGFWILIAMVFTAGAAMVLWAIWTFGKRKD